MNEIVPDNIQAILDKKPFDIEIMDVADEVAKHNIPLITSSSIFQPNSTEFHPEGLFSEAIFGRVTDPERYTNEGHIYFNTSIIHQVVFNFIVNKKRIYVDILRGSRHAIYDHKNNKFEIADSVDKGADTGYAFFIKHFPLTVNAKEPKGLRASNMHKLLVKYKDNLFTTKMIVMPAGMRDIDMSTGRLAQDDINKIYLSILNLSAGLVDEETSKDTLFDGIRWQLQMKVHEIDTYNLNAITGKKGFFQGHFGARKIALTTRNVISVGITSVNDPHDPGSIKADETMIPLLQTIKNFQPFFVNYIRDKLYGEIFTRGNTEVVAVTNAKFDIEYVDISHGEIKKVTDNNNIVRIINKFKYVGFRESPVSIRGVDKKDYWLILTYKIDDKVYLGKNKDELKVLVERSGDVFDIANVSPLTWSEAMYIAAVNITKGKHVFITRYPVLVDGSIYPSKVHVITTDPAKHVTLIFDTGKTMELYHYPTLGVPYFEATILHPSKLPGLNADMDGDTISVNGIWGDDSNDEISAYLGKLHNVIGIDMKLKIQANTDIIELVLFNISRE
jgi:hypothetical protein